MVWTILSANDCFAFNPLRGSRLLEESIEAEAIGSQEQFRRKLIEIGAIFSEGYHYGGYKWIRFSDTHLPLFNKICRQFTQEQFCEFGREIRGTGFTCIHEQAKYRKEIKILDAMACCSEKFHNVNLTKPCWYFKGKTCEIWLNRRFIGTIPASQTIDWNTKIHGSIQKREQTKTKTLFKDDACLRICKQTAAKAIANVLSIVRTAAYEARMSIQRSQELEMKKAKKKAIVDTRAKKPQPVSHTASYKRSKKNRNTRFCKDETSRKAQKAISIEKARMHEETKAELKKKRLCEYLCQLEKISIGDKIARGE